MAEVTEDFLTSLKAVRGEFQNTRGGRIGNKVLAHVFSSVFPVFFVGYLFVFGNLGWPLSDENWLFLVFGFLTFALGLVLHKTINSRYVFSDEGIQEFRPSGHLKKTIRWAELTRVDFRESRGLKSFSLFSESEVMHLEYYKELSDAIAELELR